FLAGRYILHFFSDYTVARIVHLREIAVAVFRPAARNPLRPRPWNFASRMLVSVLTIAVLSVARRHDLRSLMFEIRSQLYAGRFSRNSESTTYAWVISAACRARIGQVALTNPNAYTRPMTENPAV